ncbi:MAG: DUF4136 domain-containing protein [Campylobacterota bacterium]|nr:DUF4136 domain-containing protein [Campylobacterota bacterium]
MKKKIVSFATILTSLFILTACSSLQVSIDNNPSINATTFPTFAIVHGGSSLNDPADNRIRSAITGVLESKGYKVASASKASFIVIYDYGQREQSGVTPVYTPAMGMYGPMYGPMGMYAPFGGYQTLVPYSYTEGQFAIRMINPKTKKAFWTADAKNELVNKKTSAEKTKYVDGLITQILKKYPVRK